MSPEQIDAGYEWEIALWPFKAQMGLLLWRRACDFEPDLAQARQAKGGLQVLIGRRFV